MKHFYLFFTYLIKLNKHAFLSIFFSHCTLFIIFHLYVLQILVATVELSNFMRNRLQTIMLLSASAEMIATICLFQWDTLRLETR